MNSPKLTVLNRLPCSGDKLVDWVFKQFVFFLRREALHIKRKRRLVNPNDPHKHKLRGLMSPQDHAGNRIDILISVERTYHPDCDGEVSTLIHELSHIVFWKTRECFIGQIERILVEKFTTKQKNYLKSFIPRYEVKSD